MHMPIICALHILPPQKHRKSTDSLSSSDQTYSTPQHSLPHMQSELVPDTQPTKLNEKKQKLVNRQPHDVKYIGKGKDNNFIYLMLYMRVYSSCPRTHGVQVHPVDK